MKVLITMYDINNPGGIINHNENLIAGLKELGHEVDFVELLWRERSSEKRVSDKTGFEEKHSGYPVHQGKGWLFPVQKRIPYKGRENIAWWLDFANQFDLVIWQIPVPTKRKDNQGNNDWPYLYELDPWVNQIAIIHDGNLAKSYPWIEHIGERLSGLACVHPCAYHGAGTTNIPRALIFNPQEVDNHPVPSWAEKEKGFISLQPFKAWKHVDDLVRSIPHMRKDTVKYLAGGGIEYNYMTSKDKCKEHYFVSSADTDIDPSEYGRKIWDVALDNGMSWLGYITETAGKEHMQKLRCLIDPSWSKAYAKVGDHFNRVVVDGMLEGAIPVARNLGISTNESGIGEVFKPGKHYVMVPYDAKPKEFADIVEEVVNFPEQEAEQYYTNHQELLQEFDRRHIAEQYIELGAGLPCGFHSRIDVGEQDKKSMTKSIQTLSEFFGV